ncbi:bifunctional UDP-N-acetylglucosamine diphosphorylase/glucosamine-1-phosphate N-acetyltransferase GlmU [bacterium]|nr:bifunctional UDP-N-acetylglucosamine diphosphorylase/glucosamine-1-phosphate N-acetyltransferase GlmU [bacterium]
MQTRLAVIVLAAGKSTRFKSEKTKVLHELCGKPMIDWVLDAVVPLKPVQVIVVYGTHSTALMEHYDNGHGGLPVDFVLQEPTLGTAHALIQCRDALQADITHLLVLPGDAPLVTTEQLGSLQTAVAQPEVVHAVLTAVVAAPGDLGRVIRDRDNPDLAGRIVEAHEASAEELAVNEINTGIYLFDRKVFAHLDQAAQQFGASEKKGEYYLPDAVRVAPTLAVQAADFMMPVGVNDREQLSDAEQVLLNRLRRYWMSEGVTFRLPETTYLHADVRLAPDVEIGPSCVLTGATKIGRGTRLVQGCLLEHCIIGANCELRHVRGLESIIEDNVSAGPYVNMRPGTVIRHDCKIGNFVETKNADIGEGSKLPHLQYIGDATLGKGCNIGAGTIFCNYDGVQKLHTTLGDGVFIGSNSALQGGITLGDEAYVAMASAITRDVPAGALAIGRARQENKDDYVRKLKERLEHRKDKAQGKLNAEEPGGGKS